MVGGGAALVVVVCGYKICTERGRCVILSAFIRFMPLSFEVLESCLTDPVWPE